MLYVQKQQHEDKKIEAANFKLLCKYSKMAIFKIHHFLFIYLVKLKYFVLFNIFENWLLFSTSKLWEHNVLHLNFTCRYHLSGNNKFNEEAVRFICAEIGSALDFLRTKKIVHRDVKPDNILLDESGHAHLTDFNVAAKHNLPHGKYWNVSH